jgi:hypothetical protein
MYYYAWHSLYPSHTELLDIISKFRLFCIYMAFVLWSQMSFLPFPTLIFSTQTVSPLQLIPSWPSVDSPHPPSTEGLIKYTHKKTIIHCLCYCLLGYFCPIKPKSPSGMRLFLKLLCIPRTYHNAYISKYFWMN